MEDHHPLVVVLEVVDRCVELPAQDLLDGQTGQGGQGFDQLTPRRPGTGMEEATSPDVIHSATVRGLAGVR